MCPPDQANEEPDGTSDAAGGADPEHNNVVGPLTDDEPRAGGIARTVAYVRTKRSKDALRKDKHRNKQEGSENRQINLVVPNDDRSRTTLRRAPIVITDPAIAELVDRATKTSRVREAMEMAAADPEFVFFGRSAATQRSLCARLARLLLRIHKIRHFENAHCAALRL